MIVRRLPTAAVVGLTFVTFIGRGVTWSVKLLSDGSRTRVVAPLARMHGGFGVLALHGRSFSTFGPVGAAAATAAAAVRSPGGAPIASCTHTVEPMDVPETAAVIAENAVPAPLEPTVAIGWTKVPHAPPRAPSPPATVTVHVAHAPFIVANVVIGVAGTCTLATHKTLEHDAGGVALL